MLQPPSDVNWLLSALAQATAAMIAIIGGLLVSRYVTLHSEQMAARRRVADLQRRFGQASTSLEEAKSGVAKHLIDDVLLDYRVFELMLESDGDIAPSSALLAVDHDGAGLDEHLVEQRVQDIRAEIFKAFEYLGGKVAEALDHESWADFRRRHDPPVSIREIWDWAYDAVCEQREKDARETQARSIKGALNRVALAGVSPNMSRLSISSPGDLARTGAVISKLHARADEADAQVSALKQEMRLAEETLNATRQPEGFRLGLQVLTTLAVLGMAVPVVLMGFAVVDLAPWVRAIVIGLFFVGVGLLLRFLFVYASFLREGGRDELPSDVIGLLRPAPKAATVVERLPNPPEIQAGTLDPRSTGPRS